MDFVKKAMDKGSGSKDTSSSGSKGSGGDDYVDKAFAAGSKKAGYNINPETSEKITDAGRGAFEKVSGQKVPDKVSN